MAHASRSAASGAVTAQARVLRAAAAAGALGEGAWDDASDADVAAAFVEAAAAEGAAGEPRLTVLANAATLAQCAAASFERMRARACRHGVGLSQLCAAFVELRSVLSENAGAGAAATAGSC